MISLLFFYLIPHLVGGARAQTITQPSALTTLRAVGSVAKTGNDFQQLINAAPTGGTVTVNGTYTAPAGTTYVISRPLNLVGNSAVLVNIRLILTANVSLSNFSFIENDCTFNLASPSACTPATPMITIGLPGYSIGSATLSNISLRYGRAYTGIAFGLCPTENVTINGFSIVDNQMSGITGLGGNHVAISNGTIVGGSQANVDDAIALYAVYGPLNDVIVQNVQAQDAFDLIGIGALMYYPITNIQVTNDQCTRTAVCLYVKSGDSSPVPAGFGGYSSLSNLSISNITDSDPNGIRYLSSIWLVGAGGATASGITIDHLTASARASSPVTARIKVFTDSTSSFSNIVISNSSIRDPSLGKINAPGYTATEGIYIQDMGSQNISGLALSGLTIDGATSYALDSGGAAVNTLTIDGSQFTDMQLAHPGAPLFLIPYAYRLNGTMVLQ